MPIGRGAPPIQIFRAVVLDATLLGPSMIRITLGGPGLADFRSTGVGDEYLRVFLPAAGSAEPTFPIPNGEHWEFPEGVEPSPMRTYTVRRADPDHGEVFIDFVLHDGGVARPGPGRRDRVTWSP